MELRTITVGDVDLVVAEAGRGGRPLLMLHGFTGAKEDFTEWLDPLAGTGWHAVAPDHRGHGASSKPSREDAYSIATLAGDALALADALGWMRFALLGHSMGGFVAQHMAHAAPARLLALVLMDTAPGRVEGIEPSGVEKASALVRRRGLDALMAAAASHPDPFETPAHRRLLAERPGYAEFGDRKMRATSAELYVAMLSEFLHREDRSRQLALLPPSLPALVMVGEQDARFVGPSRRMAKIIPTARLEVIPDAGHSPQFENPDVWWRALSGFLGAVAGESMAATD